MTRTSNRTSTRLLATTLLGTALLAAAAGCATSAAGLRTQRLEAALDATRIDRPLDEIWPVVRHLLAEQRLALAGKDAKAEGQGGVGIINVFSRAKETVPTRHGGRLIETGWGPRRVRYLAEAVPAGGGWRVTFTAVTEHANEHGHDGERRRDTDLELELLHRLAPELAADLLARVDGTEPPPRREPAPDEAREGPR